MLITRKAEFSASHRCYNAELSEAENRDLYGERASSHGHGHNYVVEVTLEGEPDNITGMVVDLKLLKQILHEHVVDVMDHRHLNHEVAPFDKVVPTVENVAREIWRRLEPQLRFPHARLHNVRLYETADLYVDYAEAAAK
ncbi:MAG TPA: 6-carboxytetrahydropterin synthase [Bryobacteraceae bacterium]|nr:6-carboxytetrahydropterin synthase [Bryobacteraceae bacterium]